MLFFSVFLQAGTVVGFKGMFSNSSDIKFQVWRPLEDDRYLLVGEKDFTPPRVPAMLEVSKILNVLIVPMSIQK